ncbi:MAG: hypothetical protein JW894_01380 [Bacteroidales bacterium]|nr:hypothetical protein [Bacteroidales bacterium]
MIRIKSTIGIILIALLTLTFNSCQKDEEENPDYVGTWVNEEVDSSWGDPVTVITTLVLTKSTFEMTMTVDFGYAIMTMAGMRGSLSVSENQFTITPNSIGFADYETGTLVWVNQGEEGWDEALAEVEMDESETATYSVEGNELTITMEGDDQVFTRQ